MQRIDLPLPDLCLLEPKVHGDSRGFFFEVWNQRTLGELGITDTFVQENHSRSARGVLRGLHYQLPRSQGKLLRVLEGEIFDVVVDLRRSSPAFGRAHTLHLQAASRRMLWVPPGFAHGFLVLTEAAEVQYAVTDYYAPQSEHALLWNDPTLGIEWPLERAGIAAPTLSAKDAAGVPLADAVLFD